MTLETAPNEASAKDNIITSGEEERAAARQSNSAAEQNQASNNQGQQQQGQQEVQAPSESDNQAGYQIVEEFGQEIDDLPEFRPEEFFNLPVGQSLSLEALQRRMNSLIVDNQQIQQDNIGSEEDYNTGTILEMNANQ